jgi:hypothetical protein
VLASLASPKEGLDMERMAMVINRDERQLRSKIESSKGDTFSTVHHHRLLVWEGGRLGASSGVE